MLLKDKKLLITGVLTPQSIAFAAAEQAIAQGAEIALTGFGRAMSLTLKCAKRLTPVPEVFELDVSQPEHFGKLHDSLKAKWGRVDGVLHAIAFAPEDALGGKFLTTPWESVQQAFRISTFSMKELSVSLAPLMPPGAGIVTLDFDNGTVAWPLYDWMGVCKAGLQATVRYLARDLGPKKIRVNAVAAGPISTIAAKGIPGFKHIEGQWMRQAPLGWDASGDDSRDAVAKTVCALLSDWMPATTGEIIHVDGGVHCIGAEPVPAPAAPAAKT